MRCLFLAEDVETRQGLQDRTEPVTRGVLGSSGPTDMVQDAEEERLPVGEGGPPLGGPVNRALFRSPEGTELGRPSVEMPLSMGSSLSSTTPGVLSSVVPRFLPSVDLFDMAYKAQGAVVDVHIFGDGRRDDTLPGDVKVYEPLSHGSIEPSHLLGRHSLFLFPRFIPFQDSPQQFCLRSWCALILSTLQDAGNAGTKMSLILEARFLSPHLPSLPLLDRRFELDRLRRFLVKVVILPDTHLNERCAETGEVVVCRHPPLHPLLMFVYRGGASFDLLPPHEVWYVPSRVGEWDLHPPEEAKAFHVLMNYETLDSPDVQHPVTALRFLMAMNALGVDETSSQFKLASSLRYPASILPTIQRAAPEGVSIAHLYVGADWLDRMEDDRAFLQEQGFSWCILSDGSDRLVMNHLPRRRSGNQPGKKNPAPQVRDAILSVPRIASLFQELLILNRWDVLGLLQDGVSRSHIAQSLEQLDNIVVQDTSQFLRVSARVGYGIVEPPEVLLKYPAALLLYYGVGELGNVTPLRSAVPTGETGRAGPVVLGPLPR